MRWPALIALAVLYMPSTHAGDFDLAWRASARLAGYTSIGDPPPVKYVDPAWFGKLGGNLRTRGDNMGGKTMAVYLNGVVYLSTDLTDPIRTMGWAIHEMTHHHQVTHGMNLTDCDTLSKAEIQAYAAQNRFLVQMGHLPHAMPQAKWCH